MPAFPPPSTWLRLAAWLLLAALVFVTLAPIGLRPVMAGTNLERALAYGAFGVLLVLAYPRRWPLCLLAVVAVAGLLEFGQALTMTRHARLSDFLVKAGAASFGALLALGLTAFGRRAGLSDRA